MEGISLDGFLFLRISAPSHTVDIGRRMDSENGNLCQHNQCRTHHNRGGNPVCGTVENWIASSKKIIIGVNKIDCSGRLQAMVCQQ